MVVGLGPRYDVCRTTRSLGGGIKEIVAARSWNHHTLPEGLALCPAILCALTYIYPSHPGVRYSRYVASCCHVRGQDSYLPPPRPGPATRPSTCHKAGTPRWFFGEGRGRGMFTKQRDTNEATTMMKRQGRSRVTMRSPRGLLAAVVFLLAVPVTLLFQNLFGSGAETTIHLALGVGSVLLASAVFDFKLPRWINWIGCVSAGALGAIFLLQAVALLIPNDSLYYFAYQVLGQWPEGRLPDLLILWFVAMLLMDSQGKTRILGFVAMSIAVASEVYKYTLVYLGTPIEAQPQMLRLLMLLPFVWLLFESTKKPHLTQDAVPSLRDRVKR